MKGMNFNFSFGGCLLICIVSINDVFSQKIEWTYAKVAPGLDIKQIAFHPRGYVFAGGLYGLYRSADNGNTWIQVNIGLGHLLDGIQELAIDSDGDIFVVLDSFVGGIARSKDNGASWVLVGGNILQDGVADALLVNAKGELLAGTSKGLFLSKDKGESWIDMNAGLKYRESPEMLWDKTTVITSFAISSKGNIVGGTRGDGIFYSTDNGRNWTLIGLKQPGYWVTCLTFGLDESILVSILQIPLGRFYRSTNRGKNWVNIFSKNLGVSPNSLATNSKGHIFAGTNKGVFRSINNGTNWSHIGLQSLINAIAVDRNGFVFLGTNDGVICKSVQSTTAVK